MDATTRNEREAAEAMHKGAVSYVPKQFLNELVPTLQQLLAVVRADRESASSADNGSGKVLGRPSR